MKRSALIAQIKAKQSMLSVGLDTDIKRVPEYIIKNFDDPIYEFNRRVIEKTKDVCVA